MSAEDVANYIADHLESLAGGALTDAARRPLANAIADGLAQRGLIVGVYPEDLGAPLAPIFSISADAGRPALYYLTSDGEEIWRIDLDVYDSGIIDARERRLLRALLDCAMAALDEAEQQEDP